MEKRKTAVREQFDRDAGRYLSRYLTPEKLRERDRILGLINCRQKFKKILDLGCGPAIISEDLLEISEKVYGVDLSEDMISVAESKFSGTVNESRIFFSVGDAEKLDFPDQYFDAVICLGVLRYLDSLEDGLREIHRVLKPEGIMIGTFYHRYSLYWISMIFLYRPLLLFISLVKKESISNMKHRYMAEPSPVSYKRFRRIFANAGFIHSDTLHSGVNFFPFNRLFPNISRAIYLKTEKLFLNSGIFGWMGSICMVKGLKR